MGIKSVRKPQPSLEGRWLWTVFLLVELTQTVTATLSYEDLFTKEEGRFFGDTSDNIAAYNNIDADECARRCLQGYGSYDGVNRPCLSFNHRPAGSLEGGSARCWLHSRNKDTAVSPGSEWNHWPHRNYFQRKDVLAPQDCTDLFTLGIQYSRVYTAGYPRPFQAYCDMDTDGGGWTVIQRRQDGSVPFDKLWVEYEQGFGNTSGEYWLGLRNIHSLTTQKQSELYVYLEDWEMNSRFARYSNFSVGDASSKYMATIGEYSGDAGDSLDPYDEDTHERHSINNRLLSTTDHDYDGASTDCANTFGQGGWWYTPSCGWALLNGQYLTGCSVPAPGTCSSANGIVWNSWKGYKYSLKKTIMMIRPINFTVSSIRPCQNGGTLTSGPEDSGLYICACAPGLTGAFSEQACTPGEFKSDCNSTCHCADGDSVCDNRTVCSIGGCAAGWEGSNCQTVCSVSEFGPNCTGTCHCASGGSVCDIRTGACSSGGCEAGWKGNNCQTECPDGMYGAGCTQTCHCANGPAACDRKTGACTGGCHDLWTGETCQIRKATVSYEELFTKEEGHFFGDSTVHIAEYDNIDAEECARRCLQGYGSYDGVNPPCLSFNHRPAGSPEGASVWCWLRSSDKDTAASPGSDWDSWPHRNYYQNKDILAPQDCTDVFALGIQYSQVSTVGYPQPSQAYCDMDTAGGGWTVIQRRQDGSVSFYNKTWTEYEQGFGNPSGEYWLGLENIHGLTTQKQNELYVYLEDWEMNSRFARYSTFSVGDASSKYTATIDGYSGDAGDSLDPSDEDTHERHSINNRQFSTTDQDNDGVISTDCANTYGQGGWWYTPSCGWALLNGQYLTGCSVPDPGTCSSADGIVWHSWKGYTYSLKNAIMMIRPFNVSVSSFKPCQSGTLTAGPEDSGLYICACELGWNGPFCEHELPSPHPTWPPLITTATIPTSQYTKPVTTEVNGKPESVSVVSIVGGTVGGAALLVVVLVTVGIIYYRRRQAAERQGPIGVQMDLTMITTDDPSDSGSAENPTCTELHEDNSPYDMH